MAVAGVAIKQEAAEAEEGGQHHSLRIPWMIEPEGPYIRTICT